jgi:hypothetical protein
MGSAVLDSEFLCIAERIEAVTLAGGGRIGV